MKQPADLGASGLVLWSTSKKIKDRCDYIAKYISTDLGPTLTNVRGNLTKCRETKCLNRGECVLRQPATECTFDFDFDDYECRCDQHYKGENCSEQRRFPY
ncbi:EGF-like domain protein [Teladorsagia circumcincta]|uniref:Hyaluronidase n=1 Tax=Teladorsagia circumcincta TaxID=45464 RepID=A0A2G9U6N1_TELCI|nr:EGF-like domain protein [Teladorsagia circumcincta]